MNSKAANLSLSSSNFLFLSVMLFVLAFSGCGKFKEEFQKGIEKGKKDAAKTDPTPLPTPKILTAENLRDKQTIDLGDVDWKYQPGDEATRAQPEFDDSGWEAITPNRSNGLVPPKSGWNGIGWFRLPLQIDESLVGQPLSLEINHPGASEIFVDGKLVRSFGKPAAAAEEEETYNPDFVPLAITFERAGGHTLAIRYSNTGSVNNAMAPMFFQMRISGLNQTIDGLLDETALNNGIKGGIFGICLAMGLLHLLLFVLYPQQIGNVFYAVFLLTQAFSTLLVEMAISHLGSGQFFAKLFIGTIAGGIYYLAFAAYLYTVLENRIPRYLKRLSLLWLALIFLFFVSYLAINLILSVAAFVIAILLFIVLMIWHIVVISIVIIRAISRKVDNSLVLGIVGFSFIAGAVISTILVSIFGEQSVYLSIGSFSCLMLLIVANAVFLARQFARTSKTLEEQLVKEIDYEKEKARLTIIEAENERRAEELEEARQLQLSMLPKKLPQLPNLQIAAYLKPATEVGGDYYDFHIGSDGTLTAAVGDATGHGLKAGTVVTATKSLFNNLAAAPDIPDTLRQISRSLKAMNLRGLFMALTLLKLKDNNLSICAAGMPSTLIYRAATKTVEEISIRALPLGSMTNFKYRGQEISLQSGDCVIVMSDGFPEMFNEAGEMLGFDKAAEVLREIGHLSPQEIVDRFNEVSGKWAGARPADDDVTFVVLKIL
jgi:serine phosphatase RsbU (regulator of sigma subunit)